MVVPAVLGWLGVFMTGSDTSANAVFGRLQAVSAERLGRFFVGRDDSYQVNRELRQMCSNLRPPTIDHHGLSAAIAERKEQLKAELGAGAGESGTSSTDVGSDMDELRFEVSELRGRLESLQSSIDALLARGESAED